MTCPVMKDRLFSTDRGTLWTACSTPIDLGPSTPTLLFLHGNSIDSRIFEPLLANTALRAKYQFILFDFPGHGRSSNAPSPNDAYFQYGYAETALAVLQHYGVKTIIPVGWSLGGHVALELISVLASPLNTTVIRMAGAMITGTPPVPKLEIKGFRSDLDISALFDPGASNQALKATADRLVDARPTPGWIIESVLRTDRIAAQTMAMKFMQGFCSDQIQIVQEFKDGWIAVVNGENDDVCDVDYCDEVCKGAPRLWQGKCLRLPGLRHAPMFDGPDVYAEVLLDFLKDCEPGQAQGVL